ncbi:MAG: cytidylate kinase-like family protein [Ignavibacteriae bacterium]|nr:cytidylate kinase-like family protein [Ignavibacteriota bacterium]
MDRQTSVKAFEKYFTRKIAFHKESYTGNTSISEPFVTISRETGAGGIQFGELLVQYLNGNDTSRRNNWKSFERNLLEQVTHEHNLPAEMAKYIPEKKISEMQDVLEQLFFLHPSEESMIRKASNTILHLAMLGNVILIGRGANIITRHLTGGVHIRLIDTLERKIKNIQDIFSISKSEAAKFIREEDKGRKLYIKKFFSSDIEDPSLYSLVINLSLISTHDAIQLVGEEIIRKRKR